MFLGRDREWMSHGGVSVLSMIHKTNNGKRAREEKAGVYDWVGLQAMAILGLLVVPHNSWHPLPHPFK